MACTSLIPGFRFHPTDVELVMFYLKRKLLGKKITVNAIAELNIYDIDPWDLPGKSNLKSGDLEWYFFCPKAKKYSSGGRSNRTTEAGFWKATGKDKIVRYNGRAVATIKTLVFHIGHKGKGERTDWVMHEYKMEDEQLASAEIIQDTNVLCKVFKKSGLGPKNGAQYGAQFNEEEWDDLAGCGDFQMAVGPVGVTVSANTQTENGSASVVSYANNINGVLSANNINKNGLVSGMLSANSCTNTQSLVAPQNTHSMAVSEPGSSGGQPVGVTVSANTQTENGSASVVSYANNINGVLSANNINKNGLVSGMLSANSCTNTQSLVAPQNTHSMAVSEPGSSGGQIETHSDMLAMDDFIFFEDLDLLMASENEAATNVKQVNAAPNEDDIHINLGNLIDVDHLNGIDFKTDGADYTFDKLISLNKLETFFVE
ncbi:uncharacterized protein LOC143587071 [Bidens hawaiensis]|uniref:uncharacterized protein LOC143587071 n=1 Tax=Bidens hawaiensis TaxID=980011 RepID=UPI00404A038D